MNLMATDTARRPWKGVGAGGERPGTLTRHLAEHFEFLVAFLRAPSQVGAVFPSSPALARAMLAGSNLRSAEAVVELGPGTGAITRQILRELGPHTTFLALELDAQAVKRLRQRFSRVKVYHDSAEQIQHYLARHGATKADYIVSGIPWANVPGNVQRQIMHNVTAALAPEGVFTTFTYLLSPKTAKGNHFAHVLRELFGSVETSSIIWRNLPPALVYRCTRHRVTAAHSLGYSQLSVKGG